LAKTYSSLTVTKVYGSFFRDADQRDLLRTVRENKLDAVVLAGNSPRCFQRVLGGHLVLDALKDQGINENKLAFANIKEQVALPHRGHRERATAKARTLIEVALAKVETSPAVSYALLAPLRSVLVVGATAGGLIAASELLGKGYRVYLLESSPTLRLQAGLKDDLLPTLTGVQSNRQAEFLFDASIKDIWGYSGQFTVRLALAGGDRTLVIGGIILAVGNDPASVKALRSTLRVRVNPAGLPEQDGTRIGQTTDPGIWFIPVPEDGGGLHAEVTGAATAVLSLTTLLDARELAHPLFTTSIDETLCGGCGTCVKTCAFAASSIDLVRKRSIIDPQRCKGCGNCVTACPTNARDLLSLPREYVTRAIHLLSQGNAANGDPRILAMLCKNCGQLALDAAGAAAPGAAYSPGVMPLQVECGGSVDTQYVLQAFQEGFDGVALLMCRSGQCHNIVGNTDMERRLGLFRAVLRSRHIDGERLRVLPVCAGDGQVVIDELQAFSNDLTAMAAVGMGR
jgi:heterodisulfide reductase subunit A-like polyferredoxin/coenzyme F420-reducing hydrogenase delta subunit